MFLNAFYEDSDVEFSLEDCIETIKNLNIREEKTVISVECNSCLVKKARKQVCCKVVLIFLIYFKEFLYTVDTQPEAL